MDDNSQQGKMIVPLLGVVAGLAMCVAAFAIHLQMQERTQRMDKERQLAAVTQEKDNVRLELKEVEFTKKRLEDQLAGVKRDLVDTQNQLASALEQHAVLSSSVDTGNTEISTLNQKVDQLESELTKVRSQRKDLESQLIALREDHEIITEQLTTVDQERTMLQAKLDELSRVPTVELGRVMVSNDEFERTPLQPVVGSMVKSSSAPAGQVLVINREYDFVVVDMGRNQGLAVGQEFQVIRDQEILATVKVEKVYEDLSAAAITSDKNIDIREGDLVHSI